MEEGPGPAAAGPAQGTGIRSRSSQEVLTGTWSKARPYKNFQSGLILKDAFCFELTWFPHQPQNLRNAISLHYEQVLTLKQQHLAKEKYL